MKHTKKAGSVQGNREVKPHVYTGSIWVRKHNPGIHERATIMSNREELIFSGKRGYMI